MDASAFDEFVSQEEAMEMAVRETMASNGQRQPEQNVSFSDDDYDDIFMNISDPALSHQDMDMS